MEIRGELRNGLAIEKLGAVFGVLHFLDESAYEETKLVVDVIDSLDF